MNIAAHASGKLNINTGIDAQADALYLSVIDYRGEELWKWSFTLPAAEQEFKVTGNVPVFEKTADKTIVTAGKNKYTFDNKNGELKEVVANGKNISFANGPRFIAARRADRYFDQFYNHDDEHSRSKERIS